MRNISQTPESGKNTRQSRSPKTNPRTILRTRTIGRMYFSIQHQVHSRAVQTNRQNLLGLQVKVKTSNRSGADARGTRLIDREPAISCDRFTGSPGFPSFFKPLVTADLAV